MECRKKYRNSWSEEMKNLCRTHYTDDNNDDTIQLTGNIMIMSTMTMRYVAIRCSVRFSFMLCKKTRTFFRFIFSFLFTLFLLFHSFIQCELTLTPNTVLVVFYSDWHFLFLMLPYFSFIQFLSSLGRFFFILVRFGVVLLELHR